LAPFEPGQMEQLALPLARLTGRDAIAVAVEVDVLLHRQVGIEAELLGHVADRALDLLGLLRDVVAAHHPAPGGRPEHAAEHANDGRLAGAVGPSRPKISPRRTEKL